MYIQYPGTPHLKYLCADIYFGLNLISSQVNTLPQFAIVAINM